MKKKLMIKEIIIKFREHGPSIVKLMPWLVLIADLLEDGQMDRSTCSV